MPNLPFAITLKIGSSHSNHTGSWRVERPIYADRLPPCNDACPAGENVQHWLYDAESGAYEAAWKKLVEQNPFPAVMGRICYHPCETSCNRGQLDEAVGINAVERFLGDYAIEHKWELPTAPEDTGRRVLVIGSGPCGLSATYHLRRLGHAVTLVESAPRLGGMMRYGIPEYRLPKATLDIEIARILDLGVDVVVDHVVHDIEAERAAGGFDAVLVAVGAQLAHRVDIPAAESARILDAVSLLHHVADDDPPLLGRRVAIYGGGDTAIDVARTARRLGATDAVIVYRRNREHMPAHDSELDEALEEGVTMRWLSTIDHLEGGRLVLEKMRLNGAGVPEPTGEFEELEADAVVLALGQDTDLALLNGHSGITIKDGVVEVSDAMAAGADGIFAGGDVVPSERTATVAIGHGKRAARSIDAFLNGDAFQDPARHELATFDHLNTWYYADAPRQQRSMLERIRRQTSFDEIYEGLTEENALFEARRCMSCGNCFECDNCFGVCPDNAVIKLGGDMGYEINLDFCKGCGICAAECPCGAITMVPEPM